MKNYILASLLLFSLQTALAQNDSIQPPYKRFPTFPPIKLLLADSSYFTKDDLNKKNAILLMLFSPDCDHCQHETEELIKNINQFKTVQIIMATVMPFQDMKAFRDKYGLATHRNIIVGRDQQYFLPVFFNIRTLPFLAFYNRKKELISVFEGSMPIHKVLEELKK